MLTICTFNIKNNYKEYNITKTNKIIKLIKDNKIDYLCTQELFDKCKKDINNKYNIYGKSRYKLKILKKYNESVGIITNHKVIFNKTKYLPFIPSLTKRIYTKIITEYNNNLITIINIHLENKKTYVKKRQLNKLLKIIRQEQNNIIITGDFNSKINHDIFINFINELKKLGIKRIPINTKTLKQSKYNKAIDHIFISNNFEVIEKKVIKDLDISDHYPLIVKLKLNK